MKKMRLRWRSLLADVEIEGLGYSTHGTLASDRPIGYLLGLAAMVCDAVFVLFVEVSSFSSLGIPV